MMLASEAFATREDCAAFIGMRWSGIPYPGDTLETLTRGRWVPADPLSLVYYLLSADQPLDEIRSNVFERYVRNGEKWSREPEWKRGYAGKAPQREIEDPGAYVDGEGA